MALDEKWSLKTHCVVLNPDKCEGGGESPDAAVQRGLSYVLSVQQLQDIRANAVAQKQGLTEQELFDAVLYYYNNDAFIEL